MKKHFKTKYTFSVILFMLVSFTFGIHIGENRIPEIEKVTSLFNKEVAVDAKIDFSSFWKTWNTINEKSPNADQVNDQERVYGAISGLIGSLNDPYSVFFNPEEAKTFQEDIAGNFTGVGMEIGIKNNILTVVAPLKNTPAEKAGIRPGDQILKIYENSTNDITIEKAVKLIRGEKGTEVILTVFHEGDKEPEEIKIIKVSGSIKGLGR